MTPDRADAPHIPVLLDEVVAAIVPRPGMTIVDATFGAGGYSHALLEAGARVYAFDRDPDAIREGAAMEAHYNGLLSLHPHRFSAMHHELARIGVRQVDAVVMDIGVSSMQLDQGERGFAFMHDGPLDMRMSQSGESAADFLNTAEEEAIAMCCIAMARNASRAGWPAPSSPRARWRPPANSPAWCAARWGTNRMTRKTLRPAHFRRCASM